MKKRIYYILLAGMVACGTAFSMVQGLSPTQGSQRVEDDRTAELQNEIEEQTELIAKLQKSVDDLTEKTEEENTEEEETKTKEKTDESKPATEERETTQQKAESAGQQSTSQSSNQTAGESKPSVTESQVEQNAISSVPVSDEVQNQRELVDKINAQAEQIKNQSNTMTDQSNLLQQQKADLEELKSQLTEIKESQEEWQRENVQVPTGTEVNEERVAANMKTLADLPTTTLSLQPTTCDKFIDGLTEQEKEAYDSFTYEAKTGEADGTILMLGTWAPNTEFRPDAFCNAIGYTAFRFVHCDTSVWHGPEQADGRMDWFIWMKSDYHKAYLTNTEQAKVIQNIADHLIKPGMTDKEAVLRFQDWISTHLTYLTDNYNPGTAIYLNYGNCQSYAQIFAEMCNHVGIPCYCVQGDSTPDDMRFGCDHIWNRACVGGIWYYFDLCWSDTDDDDGYNLDYMFSTEPFENRVIIDYSNEYWNL